MDTVHKLIIIGSGPAGLTAAVYAARANLQPLVIEGSTPGGQLMNTTYVENWPGEIRILGPTLMMNMKKHAQHYGTELLPEDVVKVDFTQKPFTLWTNRDKQFKAESIIIATGAKPKRLHCPGEDEYWGKGITTCAVCDGAFYPDKNVIIIGGGDTAMEDASFMKKFTNKITIIQNLDTLTASKAMQQRILKDPDIKILYNSSIKEFKGDGQHLTGATVINLKTNETQEMQVDGAFIAIGLIPNTKPFEGHIALDDYGYIQIENNTETSVKGVFSAGDVHDYRYKQAITSAGSGCKAALDAERYLSSLE